MKRKEVSEMNLLRIIDYILLLILVVGFAYMTYLSFQWNRLAGIVIPIIVIVLLFIEDRRK
jgi:membrane protein YdbS with pleckstrin-like domain